jgi:hypothetical protein
MVISIKASGNKERHMDKEFFAIIRALCMKDSGKTTCSMVTVSSYGTSTA